MSSESLTAQLETLKQKRKSGELDAKAFYQELLGLVASLVKELEAENISDEDVKKQIPLMLVFLEEQFKKMKDRGH